MKLKKGFEPKDTFKFVLLMLAVILMVLPLATSFNELLTRLVEDANFYQPIQLI